MKNVIRISMLTAIFAIAMFSCKKDEKTLTSIAVTTQPTKTTYTVGENFNPAGMVVTATYSDKSTASVANSSLTITADFSSAGTKSVSISFTDNGKTVSTSVSCTVNPATVAVESVTVSPKTLSLAVGAKQTLEAAVAPTTATNKTVTWSSNNTAAATVDATTGEVTAVASDKGTATITATADGKSDACVVTVTEPVAVESVTVSPKTLTLAAGAKQTLSATVVPATATVTWSSDNTAAATVNATTGEVTAVASDKGTATITATAGDKSDDCTVTVLPGDAVPTAIAITTSSTQRNYGIGEPFNPEGIVVTVTWSEGSPTTVTGDDPDLDFEYDFLSTGTKVVTIKYKGLVTTATPASGANVVNVQTLNQRVAAITGTGTIMLYADETITSYISLSSKNITLTGVDEMRTIKCSYTSYIFSVDGNGALTLGDKVTIDGSGVSNRSYAAVYVTGSNAVFTMKAGSKITGNNNTSGSYQGGAVHVNSSTGSFIMEGGEISGNQSQLFGGGVNVYQGTFTMSGGEIRNNTLSSSGRSCGEDVYIDAYSSSSLATFNLSGGAQIGKLALYATSNSVKSSVTLNSNFTGSVAYLDLVGSNNTLATSVGYWTTSSVQVVRPVAGQSLTKALLDKFTLRNFINSNGSLSESITAGSGAPGSFGYHLYGAESGENITANMGMLAANAPTADPVPVSIAITTMPAQRDYGIKEPFNPAGMVVTVSYDYGPTSTVNGGSAELSYTYDFSAAGTNKAVQVRYKDLYAQTPTSGSNNINVLTLNQRISAMTNGTITLYDDEIIASSISISSKNITLIGSGSARTIKCSSTNYIFSIGSNGALTLGDKVTIDGSGVSNRTSAAVYVSSANAVFTMKAGSKITGNMNTYNATSSQGGAVNVYNGSFVMEGGEISGNQSYYFGGGVHVYQGTFTMSGGEIRNNTLSGSSYSFGEDVYIDAYSSSAIATFNLSGGAQIGKLALYATSNSAKSSVTLNSNFTGSVAALDLVGSNNTLATSKGYWTSSVVKVITPATGQSLSKALLDRFTLQNFKSANGSGTELITTGYHLYGTGVSEGDTGQMGMLVSNL